MQRGVHAADHQGLAVAEGGRIEADPCAALDLWDERSRFACAVVRVSVTSEERGSRCGGQGLPASSPGFVGKPVSTFSLHLP